MYQTYDPLARQKKKESGGFGKILSGVLSFAKMAEDAEAAKSAVDPLKPKPVTPFQKLLHGDDGKSWEQEAAEDLLQKKKNMGPNYQQSMGFGRLML